MKRLWVGVVALVLGWAPNAAAQSGYPSFAQVWDVTITGASESHGFGVADADFRGQVRVLAGPNGAFGAFAWEGMHLRWAAGAWEAESIDEFSVVLTNVLGSRGREAAVWHLGGDAEARHLQAPHSERRGAFHLPEEPTALPRDFNLRASPQRPTASAELLAGTWIYATQPAEASGVWSIGWGGTFGITAPSFNGGPIHYTEGAWSRRGAQDAALQLQLIMYSGERAEKQFVTVTFLTDDYMRVAGRSGDFFLVRTTRPWLTRAPETVRQQMLADARWQDAGCDAAAVELTRVRVLDVNSDGALDLRTDTPCRAADGWSTFTLWLADSEGNYREVFEYQGSMLAADATDAPEYALVGYQCNARDECEATAFAWNGEAYVEAAE